MIYNKSRRIHKPCVVRLLWHVLAGNLLHTQGHQAESLFARLIVSQAATFCCLTRTHAVAAPNLAATKPSEIKKTRRQARVCRVAALPHAGRGSRDYRGIQGGKSRHIPGLIASERKRWRAGGEVGIH